MEATIFPPILRRVCPDSDLAYYRNRRASGASARSVVSPSTPSRPGVTLVPLEVSEHSVTQSVIVGNETGSGATLFVELAGGRRVGVVSDFDAGTLRRLIAVLEQALCDAGSGRGYANLCRHWRYRHAPRCVT
jgi:hypothetical protein